MEDIQGDTRATKHANAEKAGAVERPAGGVCHESGARAGNLVARACQPLRRQLEFLRGHLAFMLMAPGMLWGPFVIRVMEEGPTATFTTMYATEAATAVLLAIVLSRANASAGRRSQACWASAAMLGLAPLGHYLRAATGDASFITASAVLGSFGRVWFFALSIQLYARMPLRESLPCVVWSYLLAVAARAVLGLPPIGLVLPLVCLLPLGFALMLGHARALLDTREGGSGHSGALAVGEGPKQAARGRQSPSRRMIATLVLEAAFFGLVIGAYRFRSGIWQSSIGYNLLGLLVKAVVLVALLALFDAWGERVRAYTIAQVALITVIAAVTAITLAYQTGVGLVVAALLTDLARYTIELALYLAALLLTSRFKVAPATALAICLTPFFATIATVYSLSIAPGAPGGYDSPLVINIAMIGVAAACIFANASSDAEERLFSPGSWQQSGEADRFALLESACETVGAEHGLTSREVEILQLVCRGRSKRYIAEHLAISENTVRWHAKNLYAKLGVNSREELLDLVEQA